MKIKLDSTTIIPTLNAAVWAAFYPKFYKPLVDGLNHGFCLADREDAVQHAFQKLMYLKDNEAYGDRPPRTEEDCFHQLRWQARAYLSHMMDHAGVHAKYVTATAAMLKDVFIIGHQGEALDAETLSLALARTLETIRREQDISRRDLDVFKRIRIYREPAKSVAKRYAGLSENNANVIAHRVQHLLEKHGPACFEQALHEEGYWSSGVPTLPFAA